MVHLGPVRDVTSSAAAADGLDLAVVKLPQAKQRFVLLPRRWVVKREFAWASRFRRLARDSERLAATLVSPHFLAFACLMLHRFTGLILSP
jgi:transposase